MARQLEPPVSPRRVGRIAGACRWWWRMWGGRVHEVGGTGGRMVAAAPSQAACLLPPRLPQTPPLPRAGAALALSLALQLPLAAASEAVFGRGVQRDVLLSYSVRGVRCAGRGRAPAQREGAGPERGGALQAPAPCNPAPPTCSQQLSRRHARLAAALALSVRGSQLAALLAAAPPQASEVPPSACHAAPCERRCTDARQSPRAPPAHCPPSDPMQDDHFCPPPPSSPRSVCSSAACCACCARCACRRAGLPAGSWAEEGLGL